MRSETLGAAFLGTPPTTFTPGGLDALPPADVDHNPETVGVAKARTAGLGVFVLAVLAGAFIALGAIFATTVAAGGSALPYGVVRLLAGVTFSLGLTLVVVAGAELFTGNTLIVMAGASRRVSSARLLGNWTIVWIGKFVGALGTAILVYFSEQYTFGDRLEWFDDAHGVVVSSSAPPAASTNP